MSQLKSLSSKINTPKAEANPNIGELVASYLPYWKWFLISILSCGFLSYIYVKINPKIYHISSNILIKTDDKGSSSSKLGGAMMKSLEFGGLSSSDNVEDEVGIIYSHTLVKQMIMDLGLYISYELDGFLKNEDLYQISPIVVDIDKNIIDTLSANFRLKLHVDKNKGIKITGKINKEKIKPIEVSQLPYVFHSDYGDLTFRYSDDKNAFVPESNSYKLLVTVCNGNYIAEQYQKNIGVGAISKKSNIISLSTADYIKTRGEEILNTLVKLYNEDALNDKNLAATNTERFIGERLSILTEDLGKIEKTVESYRKNNLLIDGETQAKLSLQKMTDMQGTVLENEIQLSLVRMMEDYLKNPSNEYNLIPTGIGTPENLLKIIAEYNELLIQRVNYLRDMHETNPVILSLNEQIHLTQKNILASLESVKKDLLKTKENWKKEENALYSSLNDMPRLEREFLEIRREQEVKTELYLFLLEKYEENALTLASNTPKAKIIDYAYTHTTPISPKKYVILFIGLLLGALIPICFLYLKEMFKFKIENKNELERLTSVPILGEICLDKSGESIVVKDGVTSSIAELFRLLRTNINFVLTNKEEKVILVTSSVSGEGKSFFVINFALSLALMRNKKVVMVGLDIRNPKLAEYLSIPSSKGITSYLASDSLKPEDIILHAQFHPNLSIVLASPIPPNPAELLLSDRIEEFFSYLRANFDYIVVDTAPVGMVSDTFTLNRIGDATIYLCRAHYTDKSHLKFVEQIVREDRLKKVSLVINGTTTKQGYEYGYGVKNEK